MQHFEKSRRKPSLLCRSLQQRLSAYAVAAGAAGVGLSALTPAAEGKVVYTPANQTIKRHGSIYLDLNHDGIIDFVISETTGDLSFRTSQFLQVTGHGSNQINCASTFCGTYPSAGALQSGTVIKSSNRRHGWINPTEMAVEVFSKNGPPYYGGPWFRAVQGYLGLKFLIKGEVHFGWARCNVQFNGGQKDRTWVLQLTGYAYETIPNKPITAGQTQGNDDDAVVSPPQARASEVGALGPLALGANGLALWRREEADDNVVPTEAGNEENRQLPKAIRAVGISE